MLERLIVWSGRHLTNRQATSIIALLIGVLASLAAFSLHKLIALIQNLLTNDFVADSFNWLYLVFPVVGIWLTISFLNPLAAVAPGAYVLWQNMVNAWQLWYKEKYGKLKW